MWRAYVLPSYRTRLKSEHPLGSTPSALKAQRRICFDETPYQLHYGTLPTNYDNPIGPR